MGQRWNTYWSLVYTQPLPYSITFTGALGFYTDKKEGQFLGTRDTFFGADCAPGTAFSVSGCFEGKDPIGSGFRTLILGVAQTDR